MFKGATAPPDCLSTTNRTGLTQMAYDADKTTVTDPADVVVERSQDALGRMVQVTEDPGTGSQYLDYETTYTYDPLDNLRTVTQGVQTRTFVYSSLSRLRSARNPESGTTHYCYDDAGNLKSRADARAVLTAADYDANGNLICPANATRVTATYTYDPLQRILTKNYSDTTPDVTYAYHTSGAPNAGLLESITSTSAISIYSYDSLGRVVSQSQTIAGHPDTFTFTNTYFLNGAMESQTYPSGRTVTYPVDDAGRVDSVTSGTTTYANPTAYTADGRVSKMQLGNTLWETRDYHTPGTPTVFKLFELGDMGEINERLALGYDYHATGNNGNLTGHTITRSGTTWIQAFAYDAVNRLASAMEVDQPPAQDDGYDRTFDYDRYGNRWVASNSGMAVGESHEPRANVFNLKNQMTNLTGSDPYDAAGNQQIYSPNRLVYDADNRLVSMTSASAGNGAFLYDGDGRRVKKTWTPGGGVLQDTYYVYDTVGNLAAEYGTGTAPASGTAYPFTDMLGSVRAVTDAAGVVQECYDYLPFGRMLSLSDNGRSATCHPTSPDSSLDSKVSQKFTGQVRDEETRLDYFGARYMSGPEGRFMSPDPLPGTPGDPQSWNLYGYVRNNPLKFVDPVGLCLVGTGTNTTIDYSYGSECADLPGAQFSEAAAAEYDVRLANTYAAIQADRLFQAGDCDTKEQCIKMVGGNPDDFKFVFQLKGSLEEIVRFFFPGDILANLVFVPDSNGKMTVESTVRSPALVANVLNSRFFRQGPAWTHGDMGDDRRDYRLFRSDPFGDSLQVVDNPDLEFYADVDSFYALSFPLGTLGHFFGEVVPPWVRGLFGR